MASIRKEISIEAPLDVVWAAVRDFGAPHRYAPGLVLDTKFDGEVRVATFANGMVVHEILVDLDEEARRLAYASVSGRLKHHHASMQVFGDGDASRIVWLIDLLPNDQAP